MRLASLQHHRDWDQLCVSEVHWFVNMIETMAGWYRPFWGWDHNIWSAIHGWAYRHRKELYTVPLTPNQACEADIALFGKESHLCWSEKEGH